MRTTLLLLALTGCIPAETGIDHTVITGTLSIPPAAVDEKRGNDSVDGAQPVGPDDSTALTYRAVVVSGKVDSWTPTGLGAVYGDPDYYRFSPIADGTFTIGLNFTTTSTGADTADTGATADADVFTVELVDLATYDGAGAGVVFSASTDGSGGAFSMDADLAAGGDYVVLVGGTSSVSGTALPYSLVLSGSTPPAAGVLVGAYAGADPTVAEHPFGGTNATDWAYDASTYTWSGAYKIMWIKGVTPAVADTDTGDLFIPSPTVQDAGADGFPNSVYVRGGTISTLDASPSAGALYATTSIAVDVTGGDVTVSDPIVLDGVFPKVIGKTITETLPDTTVAEINLADSTLNLDTLVAQDVGELSGLGYVDVVTGSCVLDPAATGWNGTNDSDAYAFTVPESMGVRMSASWADPGADIDFGIWYDDPDYGPIDLFSSFGDSYCMTGANPELCESAVTLEPDTTYYLLALGYVGTDEQAYTIDLEWVAP